MNHVMHPTLTVVLSMWQLRRRTQTESSRSVSRHTSSCVARARNVRPRYRVALRVADILEVAPEEGILIAMSTLIQPGDTVIVTWPAYQSLYEVARARGASVQPWRAIGGVDEPSRFDVDDLAAQLEAAGGRATLVVVNFPHNPTGAWLSSVSRQPDAQTSQAQGDASSVAA